MSEFCSMDLFEDFIFVDITTAQPPAEKGLYVIRVRNRGMDPEEILDTLRPRIAKLRWNLAEDYLLDRIGRIKNIDSRCPIIYIGSAGTSQKSRHTLAGRYQDLLRRHTVRFPVWALLYFGWELEFGWKVTNTPKELEAELKAEFRKRKTKRLPALAGRRSAMQKK